MQKITPTPRTLTLRFKHNATTILLEVDPLYTFASVRAELLQALQETSPNGLLNGHKIPQNPDDIILGKAVDRNDLRLGYSTIGKDVVDAESGKGKGKGATTTAKGGAAQIKDCPEGAGLRNADVVAFKFKSEGGEKEGAQMVEEWDVVVPTMAETYGDEDLPDEGIEMADD